MCKEYKYKENNYLAKIQPFFDMKRWRKFRGIVMPEAGISRASFYNYHSGLSKEPKLVTEKVREILLNNFADILLMEISANQTIQV